MFVASRVYVSDVLVVIWCPVFLFFSCLFDPIVVETRQQSSMNAAAVDLTRTIEAMAIRQ